MGGMEVGRLAAVSQRERKREREGVGEKER